MEKEQQAIQALDVIIDRNKFNRIKRKQGYRTNRDFHDKLIADWGLELSYNGFQSVLYNNSPWRLLYAWAVAHQLKCSIEDLFTVKRE